MIGHEIKTLLFYYFIFVEDFLELTFNFCRCCFLHLFNSSAGPLSHLRVRVLKVRVFHRVLIPLHLLILFMLISDFLVLLRKLFNLFFSRSNESKRGLYLKPDALFRFKADIDEVLFEYWGFILLSMSLGKAIYMFYHNCGFLFFLLV